MLVLVPSVATGFAMFTAFPLFEAQLDGIRDFLQRNVLPGRVDNIERSVRSLFSNSGGRTAVGVLAPRITAIVLLVVRRLNLIRSSGCPAPQYRGPRNGSLVASGHVVANHRRQLFPVRQFGF